MHVTILITIDSEECSEDVRARMYAIQENELDQLRDLTSFLDMELHYVEQYLEVLRETRAGWIDEWVECSVVSWIRRLTDVN